MTKNKSYNPLVVKVAKLNNDREFSRFFNNMVQNLMDMDNAKRHRPNKKVSKKLDLANRRIAELQRENENLRKQLNEQVKANEEFVNFCKDLAAVFHKYALKSKNWSMESIRKEALKNYREKLFNHA